MKNEQRNCLSYCCCREQTWCTSQACKYVLFVSFKLTELLGASFLLGWEEVQSLRGLPALQRSRGQTIIEHQAGLISHGEVNSSCGCQLSLQWPGLPRSQSIQRLFIPTAKYEMGNWVKLRAPKPRSHHPLWRLCIST